MVEHVCRDLDLGCNGFVSLVSALVQLPYGPDHPELANAAGKGQQALDALDLGTESVYHEHHFHMRRRGNEQVPEFPAAWPCCCGLPDRWRPCW